MNQGRLAAVCISPRKGTPKHEVSEAALVRGFGMQDDAHAGNWHRQVSFLDERRIMDLCAKAAERGQPLQLVPGAFGENFVTRDFDLSALSPGRRFLIGSAAGAQAVLQVTQIGKECHNPCVISRQTGECIMPVYGVFGRVLRGGTVRAGDWIGTRPEFDRVRFAVLTISDKGSRGERVDEGGPLVSSMVESALDVTRVEAEIIPDDQGEIERRLLRLADEEVCDLIITTGGTGLSPRDVTPEATLAVIDRQIPGIAEAMRAAGLAHTPRAMLSRAVCGMRGASIILNLSGSPKAVREQLSAVLPVLSHAIETATGIPLNCAK